MQQVSTNASDPAKFLSLLQDSASKFRQKYMSDLRSSYDDFVKDRSTRMESMSASEVNLEHYLRHREECQNMVNEAFQNIQTRLMRSSCPYAPLLQDAYIWPRITPWSLLRLLSASSATEVPHTWKEAIVRYGRLITYLQQADRLVGHFLRSENTELMKEMENKGGQGWDMVTRADWLLVEVENNFMIRPTQADVAREMISPSSGRNSVLQLNMGEGKSSVIVPIVSTALADAHKLVRVVVLKPLTAQMFGILSRRLGGLSNTRIFYLPFSRALKPDPQLIERVQNIFDKCMRVRGILLVQPEHILSFKLMGLERLTCGDDYGSANALIQTQEYLHNNARDIFDESDEILSVRYQLIYTVGLQQSMHGHPTRWTLIQEIFDLIQEHIKPLHDRFMNTVEFTSPNTAGCFPHTRILQLDAGLELLSMIVSDVCSGKLSSISLRLFPERMQQLARDFIQNKNLGADDYSRFQKYCTDTGAPYDFLVLLRGLIAHGILLFALKEKRWRVDYGLDKTRTGLAVPYRAKDVPATRAEYGHPDVAITLTCLSYYYQGLTNEEVQRCIQRLSTIDNPAVLYERWIEGCNAPEAFRNINGINLDNPNQCSEYIFPLFRFNKRVIDFYLNCFIFPKEAKEFLLKLSTSGWDLAEAKAHPITGFSGTNDNRYYLPLSTDRCDLMSLSGTNARVILYLLQPENNHYKCAQNIRGQRLNTDQLLDVIVDATLNPPVTVLIDVGAQVLDLQNKQVAERWLSKSSKFLKAALYFDENDEVMVIGRDGRKEPFIISAYSMRMEVCLV